MSKKILLFVLISSSSYSMEIERIDRMPDEKTPLLLTIKEERPLRETEQRLADYRNSVTSYLDRLPAGVRYQVSIYLKPGTPAMQKVLEKISLDPDQAIELYKKFLTYNRADSLSQLIKNKMTHKLIEKLHTQQKKELAQTCYHAKHIAQESEPEKMLTFMSEKSIPLETLEELTIETLPPVQEQVVMSKDIINKVDPFIQRRECMSKISSAMAQLHTPHPACFINFGCAASAFTTIIIISLCFTHWGIGYGDLWDCQVDQSNKCWYGTLHANATNYGCFGLNQTMLYDCCNNYSQPYCDSWKHNYTLALPHENLKVWTPFIITGSVFIFIQLMALIIARSNSCCFVDPQTKAVIGRYKTKIKELHIEEV